MFGRLALVCCVTWNGIGGGATCAADRGELKSALDALLNEHATAKRSTVTLKAVDLESGDALYERGADKLLTPASNLKIYTSACALNLFGPAHRFATKVQLVGDLRDGKLSGYVTLVGGGDAMFTSRDLAGLADRVIETGLREVVGGVTVDNARYASPLKGPGWMWDDEPSYYNMSVTPLMVDFNVLKVRLSSVDGKLTATLDPPSDYPAIERIEGAKDAEPTITRTPFEHPLLLSVNSGRLADSREERLTMHDPARWVAGMFKQMLEARGVKIRSGLFSTAPTHVVREFEHQGPTLAETLKHFNHMSENAVGEVLLHEVAIARGVKRPKWSDGARAISEWLVKEAGLDEGSSRLVDGSGLSRYDLISADSAVKLLEYMHGSEHFEAFFNSLPTSDVDGQPIVRAKGGSMTSVSTISGYLKTRGGRMLAFSLLANGYIGSSEAVMDLRQSVWRELYRCESN